MFYYPVGSRAAALDPEMRVPRPQGSSTTLCARLHRQGGTIRSLRQVRCRFLASVLTAVLVAPISPAAAGTSLGTARGFGPAKLSVDAGKNWLPLGGRSFPIIDGAELRSTGGGAVLDLTDGSRVDVFPFSAIRFETSGETARISILYGRVRLRLPAQTQVEVVTSSARLEPMRHGPMVGEIFVSGSGLMGLKMTQGDLRVTQLGAPQRVLLASREPLFLPKGPSVQGFYFTSDTPEATPRDARAIFGPSGHSIGYLTAPDNLVIQPGFTAHLTRPLSGQMVRLAMAKIPPADVANDAMPLFDLGGHYVGYVSGPMFYAQNSSRPSAQQPETQEQQPGAEGEEEFLEGTPTGMSIETMLVISTIVIDSAIGAGVWYAVSSGGGRAAPSSATPVRP